MGEAPGVGAVVVVVDEVLVEVVLERRAFGDERSCEGRAPALFQDGELDALDAPVAVRAPGADESLARPDLGDGVAELAGAEFRSVVGGDLVQLQPAAASSAATRCKSSRVCRARGLRCEACSSAQV